MYKTQFVITRIEAFAMSENFCSNEMKPDVDGYVEQDEEEEHCQPPSTFSVETVSPDEQKLNWYLTLK